METNVKERRSGKRVRVRKTEQSHLSPCTVSTRAVGTISAKVEMTPLVPESNAVLTNCVFKLLGDKVYAKTKMKEKSNETRNDP